MFFSRHPTDAHPRSTPPPEAPAAPALGQATDPPAADNTAQGERRFRLTRPWIYGLAGLGTVGLLVLVFRPAPVRVDLVTVERQDLQVTVEAEGRTRVQDRFVVAAPIDGRVARIELSAGDTVEPGDLLARLDPLPLTSEVRQAQARIEALRAEMAGVETQRPKAYALEQARDRIQVARTEHRQAQAHLAQAQAEFAQAQRNRERAEDLVNQGAISAQDFEATQLAETARGQGVAAAAERLQGAEATVNAAQQDLALLQAEQRDPDYLLAVYQAEIDQVEAALDRLADDAQRTDITAPARGKVLRVPQTSARYVTAGTPLMELGNPEALELEIDVLSADAVNIQPGDTILVNQWGGSETLVGQVRIIEPAAFTKVSALGVEEQRVNIIGDFVSPPGPLGDGFRVDTQIVIDEAKDALTVPISALFPCDLGTCLFTVEAGRARQTVVIPGPRNTFETVIERGLNPQDQVIAFPESVEAGDRVIPR
ncbi:MAG: HlyD family efflux transporter periplasmic adaptor subunit [Leptolyngbya sp.]|nr:HlyD family efflux transporter periplasmic adaptor subunit [Leptolyngbya sp.]